MLAKKQGNANKAQQYFQQIKTDFPASVQGEDIDRYLN